MMALLLTQEEQMAALKLFRNRWFKHVDDRNNTTAFLPLKIKGGSLSNVKYKYDKNPYVKHVKFLTEDQAQFVCNEVNARRKINTKTIQQEMSATERNAYKNAILNDVDKKKGLCSNRRVVHIKWTF